MLPPPIQTCSSRQWTTYPGAVSRNSASRIAHRASRIAHREDRILV